MENTALPRIALIGGSIAEQDGEWRLGRQMRQLIAEIAAGCDEVVYCPVRADGTFDRVGRSPYQSPLGIANARVVPVPAADPGQSVWRKARAVAARLGRYGQCVKGASFVLIAMPSFSGWLATVTCRLCRKPYGLYFAADWDEMGPFVLGSARHGGAVRSAYRALARRAERSAVVRSRFTLVAGRALLEKFGPLHAHVVQATQLVAIGEADWHERMDSCLGRPVRILYVGQMIARKGVRVVVDAVARLRAGGHDVELELVGTGEPDYVKELERQVEDRGLAGRVRFAGYVHDVRELLGHYRGADVFAIGTMAEGFPRVVYEAMTQGLPVVATGIGTISAMVRDGEEAVLVTPGDSAAMAEGLERVIRDAELRRRLIRNGYAFARACFGPERPSAQIMALIHQYGRP